MEPSDARTTGQDSVLASAQQDTVLASAQMNRDAILSTVVLLSCVLALGATASSLNSAVSTRPDEVITVDYASLPVGSDRLAELGERVNPSRAEAASPTDEDSQHAALAASTEKTETSKRNERDRSGASRKSAPARQTDRGPGRGTRETGPSLLDRLLALLRSLLDLLPVLLAATLVGLAVRHREHIPSLRGDESRTGTDGGASVEGVPSPDNEVAEAWHEAVSSLDLDDHPDLTPRERAEMAATEGVDADAISTLTRLFEEVTYGDAPVTKSRRERARECSREIRGSEGLS